LEHRGFACRGAIALPIMTVLAQVFVPSGGAWAHLSATVLPLYLRNSLLL